jgi:hypothetical protein
MDLDRNDNPWWGRIKYILFQRRVGDLVRFSLGKKEIDISMLLYFTLDPNEYVGLDNVVLPKIIVQ